MSEEFGGAEKRFDKTKNKTDVQSLTFPFTNYLNVFNIYILFPILLQVARGK